MEIFSIKKKAFDSVACIIITITKCKTKKKNILKQVNIMMYRHSIQNTYIELENDYDPKLNNFTNY